MIRGAFLVLAWLMLYVIAFSQSTISPLAIIGCTVLASIVAFLFWCWLLPDELDLPYWLKQPDRGE